MLHPAEVLGFPLFHAECTQRSRKSSRSLLHSLALALTLALTLTLNHFVNEPLQTAAKLYGLMYFTYGSVTDYHGCPTDYKTLIKVM